MKEFLASGRHSPGIVCKTQEQADALHEQIRDVSMLYVACTRAMHRLHLTHAGAPSPFLEAAMNGRLRPPAPNAFRKFPT